MRERAGWERLGSVGRRVPRCGTVGLAAVAFAVTLVASACGQVDGTVDAGASQVGAAPAVVPADGISVTGIPGERPIVYDVLVDGDGCALAGTFYWGVGEVPTVWTGTDCATALTLSLIHI